MENEFYKWLTENHYFWDRKNENEIWVALNGYKCFDERRTELEKEARKAKHLMVAEDFDKYSGKTFYRFKHK